MLYKIHRPQIWESIPNYQKNILGLSPAVRASAFAPAIRCKSATPPDPLKGEPLQHKGFSRLSAAVRQPIIFIVKSQRTRANKYFFNHKAHEECTKDTRR
jgi:hypothetical protein